MPFAGGKDTSSRRSRESRGIFPGLPEKAIFEVCGEPCRIVNNKLERSISMEEQVLKAMKEAGKPVRPGDIAKVLGVDSKEVSKACAELKKAGKIYSPKRCYYEPVAE